MSFGQDNRVTSYIKGVRLCFTVDEGKAELNVWDANYFYFFVTTKDPAVVEEVSGRGISVSVLMHPLTSREGLGVQLPMTTRVTRHGGLKDYINKDISVLILDSKGKVWHNHNSSCILKRTMDLVIYIDVNLKD